MKQFITFLTLLTTTSVVAAEPKVDWEEATKKLAPFVDQHTFLVGRLDVQRFDLSGFQAILEPLFPVDTEQKAALRMATKAWQDDFTKKGGREIFIVYGACDFLQAPCLLAPIADAPKYGNELAELLKMPFSGREIATENINGFLCVGPRAAIERLKNRKPFERDDIRNALISTSDAPCQIVFVPNAESRKIFEQIAPTLPAEVGGGSIETFTKGMKWISLTVGPPPKVEMRFVLQAADVDAAKKIDVVFGKGLEAAHKLFQASDAKERETVIKIIRRFSKMLMPAVDGDKLLIKLDLGIVVPELAGVAQVVHPASRTQSTNVLRQLGLAAHNYLYAFGHFPTNIADKNGKPLLSWRVAVLPFLDQEALYRQFKLDEPWDSDHNKTLIPKMPSLYRAWKQRPELKDRTTYLAPLGQGLMWDNPKGIRVADVPDGTVNTILLVESNDDRAVIWTKPDDIAIDKKDPTKGLIGHLNNGFFALFCDGSVRIVSKDYSAIWALFTRSGGEVTPEK